MLGSCPCHYNTYSKQCTRQYDCWVNSVFCFSHITNIFTMFSICDLWTLCLTSASIKLYAVFSLSVVIIYYILLCAKNTYWQWHKFSMTLVIFQCGYSVELWCDRKSNNWTKKVVGVFDVTPVFMWKPKFLKFRAVLPMSISHICEAVQWRS